MNKDQFFETFGLIDPRYVLSVAELLERGEAARVRPRRRLWRTLLIAAALTALLSATAYATGIFGLEARRIPLGTAGDSAAQRVTRDYISLSGVAGTPEYLAAARWLAFRNEYTARMDEQSPGWRDLERRFAADEEEKAVCRLYQVWDETMWESLREIAAEYGLHLHGSRSLLPRDEMPLRSHGQYEDGSFLASAAVRVEGELCSFELYRERRGALPCDDLTAAPTDRYREWEYETAAGERVSIALQDVSDSEFWTVKSILIFYTGEDTCLTVRAGRGRLPGEDSPDDRRWAELLADGIDFAACAAAPEPEEALAAIFAGTGERWPVIR